MGHVLWYQSGSLQETLWFVFLQTNIHKDQSSSTATRCRLEIHFLFHGEQDGLRRLPLHQERTLRSQHTLRCKYDFSAFFMGIEPRGEEEELRFLLLSQKGVTKCCFSAQFPCCSKASSRCLLVTDSQDHFMAVNYYFYG